MLTSKRILANVTVLAMLLAFCVVGLGAYVRLSDAGLGCPDWPGCYGAMSVPQSESAIQHAQQLYPDKPIHAPKAWKEMVHRYFAGTLGLMILFVFINTWRLRGHARYSRLTATLLLLLVMLQAALGMWTVTLLLKPVIVTAHLLGGMSTLALLTWMSHRYIGISSPRFVEAHSARFLIRLALLVLLIQIMLGGWTSSNYAAMACTDFPTCHGQWWPEMDINAGFHLFRALGESAPGVPLHLPAYTAIQWMHRLGAVVTACYMLTLAILLWRKTIMRPSAMLLILLVMCQFGLGVANLVLHLPLPIAVAHNMVAALLLMTVVVMNSKITGHKIRIT